MRNANVLLSQTEQYDHSFVRLGILYIRSSYHIQLSIHSTKKFSPCFALFFLFCFNDKSGKLRTAPTLNVYCLEFNKCLCLWNCADEDIRLDKKRKKEEKQLALRRLKEREVLVLLLIAGDKELVYTTRLHHLIVFVIYLAPQLRMDLLLQHLLHQLHALGWHSLHLLILYLYFVISVVCVSKTEVYTI